MTKIRLFFILLIFLSAGCDEEEETSLLGQWMVTWKVADETLTGDIKFFPDSAILTAYGHDQSLLIQQPSEMKYSWKLSANELILKPLGEEFSMEYQILQASTNEWTLRCFDEITLSLSRRAP